MSNTRTAKAAPEANPEAPQQPQQMSPWEALQNLAQVQTAVISGKKPDGELVPFSGYEYNVLAHSVSVLAQHLGPAPQ